MPPKKTKSKSKIRCKKCNTVINPAEVPPNKTWTMTSPMPSKDGSITITIMATFTCPQCHSTVRATLKKIKGSDIDIGKPKKATLLEIVSSVKEKTPLTEIAQQLSMSPQSVQKAIEILIKRGELQGKIENGEYIP